MKTFPLSKMVALPLLALSLAGPASAEYATSSSPVISSHHQYPDDHLVIQQAPTA